MPNATIYRGVKLGKNTVIHSGVSIRENCEIGANCIIHNNSTIGSDGFGYAKAADKSWLKIPQTGRVVIEDDVEIGANTAIDCASVGETRIKRGAKIDNLVQIGHSCTVDEDALICSQTGLAGSSVIGKRVILAGQVGIAGHLTVGDDAVITAKSATSHNVEPGKIISGIPGFDNKDWLRSTAVYRKLGEMAQPRLSGPWRRSWNRPVEGRLRDKLKTTMTKSEFRLRHHAHQRRNNRAARTGPKRRETPNPTRSRHRAQLLRNAPGQ